MSTDHICRGFIKGTNTLLWHQGPTEGIRIQNTSNPSTKVRDEFYDEVFYRTRVRI